MASVALELDGVTSFASRPKVVFRYMVVVDDDKLSVWLVDCKSKKQWQSDQLPLDAFATTSKAIPGATVVDYAKCFKSALDSDGSGVVDRDVADDANSALKLTFTVHLKVFEGSWSPQFALLLKPVVLERLDYLEACLCDVEDLIWRLIASKTRSRRRSSSYSSTTPLLAMLCSGRQ